jgi:hypothetical protein
VPLPADWKTRLETRWRTGKPSLSCRLCGTDNGDTWEMQGLNPDPPTVALVCPRCGNAEVFRWEVLEWGQQV